MTDKQLIENIGTVFKKVSHAAIKAGRNPEEIKIVAVTKTVGTDLIKSAIDAGLRIFGENRVQEAKEKIQSLKFKIRSSNVEWHLIGHLQKNKAKAAVELFDLIHSVDSIELAETLNRQAEKLGKIQKILLQVKLSDEASKSGIIKNNFQRLLETVRSLGNIKIEGLMTIPPFFDDPEMSRPYFAELRKIRDNAKGEGLSLHELSMGMTGDYEAAIEEGATIVRIGTAIFGLRKCMMKEAV